MWIFFPFKFFYFFFIQLKSFCFIHVEFLLDKKKSVWKMSNDCSNGSFCFYYLLFCSLLLCTVSSSMNRLVKMFGTFQTNQIRLFFFWLFIGTMQFIKEKKTKKFILLRWNGISENRFQKCDTLRYYLWFLFVAILDWWIKELWKKSRKFNNYTQNHNKWIIENFWI